MAKNNDEQAAARQALQERRQQLLERKQDGQKRILRYAIYGVAGLIGLIILVGIVFEFFVTPNQAVAQVGDSEITLAEWQEVVSYQRAQLVIGIEEQYDLFVGDEENVLEDAAAEEERKNQALRTIQQFSGQQIGLLTGGYEQLGDFVLQQMVNDELIRQGAEERGIVISDAELDAAVGERFNFFDGDSPTPFPTSTDAPEPTPSITPLGFVAVEEEATEEAAVEPLPEPTERPTSTPVSQESFDEQLSEELGSIDSLGASPDLYRNLVMSDIYRERMGEALFAESGEPTVVPHVSFFLLEFDDLATAEEVLASTQAVGFLEVWNNLRTLSQAPQPTEGEAAEGVVSPGRASEVLWRTEAQLGEVYLDVAPAEILALDVDGTSAIIEDVDIRTGLPVYLIVQVSGKEDRELSSFTIDQIEQELLTEWVEEQRIDNVTIFENWQGRVPRQPLLDEQFRNPAPTAAAPAQG